MFKDLQLNIYNSSALLFLGHLWVEKSVSPSAATNPIRWSSTSRETTFMMPRNSNDSLSTGVKRSLKVVLRSHWRGIGHCPKVIPWDATSVPQKDLFNTGYELQLHRNGGLLARSAGKSSQKSLSINMEGHGKQTGESVDGISVSVRQALFRRAGNRSVGVSGRYRCQLQQKVAWLLQLLNLQATYRRVETALVIIWSERRALSAPWISSSVRRFKILREMCGRGSTPSATAIAEANSLSVGFSISNHLFDATIERLAFLLHSTETKSDCCQWDGRDDSGWDLDDAVGEHCIFLATTALLFAARFFAGDLVGHGLIVCLRRLLRRNVHCRRISEGITDPKGLDPWPLTPLLSLPPLDGSLLVFVWQRCSGKNDEEVELLEKQKWGQTMKSRGCRIQLLFSQDCDILPE